MKTRGLPLAQACGLVVVIALFTGSCSFLGLRQQVVKLGAHGSVTIEVSPTPAGTPPTYALAWTRAESGELESAGFQTVGANGIVSFSLLLKHVYGIVVFTDENRNGKYDANEPMACLTNVIPISFADPTASARLLKITLTREHVVPLGTVIAVPKNNSSLGTVLNIALGDIVPLDDPRFSPESGSSGMWRPLDFLSDNTFGIYFTEAYDPQKTPVILVHGIGGTPRDWSYVIDHFDHSRYQLWFYYYPSGMRLDRAGNALSSGMLLLQQRYGFSRCCIVAHSMGGLVCASAIREPAFTKGTNFIAGFVTISSPFSGVSSAASAIKYLKYPVPSWIDINPGSEFLKTLHGRPLPPGTHYDLIYGGNGMNDGVVTTASMLEKDNLKHAASATYFPYRHVEILNQAVTVARVLECLQNDLSKNPQTTNAPSGVTNVIYHSQIIFNRE
jgi:pimeloyl-ACP methyl ester carboxylesterase